MDGQENDIPIRFLIDSGALECFISETMVEDSDFLLRKSQAQLKIHVVDGSVRSSNQC